MTVQLPLSAREKVSPGTIERLTGKMEMCYFCHKPFRMLRREGEPGCGCCQVPSFPSK
jgi:hypothetical protein